jgi:hypothetical protein
MSQLTGIPFLDILLPAKQGNEMRPAKKAPSASKKYPPGSYIGKLRKPRIIETLAAFILIIVALRR